VVAKSQGGSANVGIAIGEGTYVVIESAGIVLVRSDPHDTDQGTRCSFWPLGFEVDGVRSMVSPRRSALRDCGSYLVGFGNTTRWIVAKTEDTLTLIARHTEMSAVLAVVAASVTTFAATNIDDLFLLVVFCAKRTPMRRVMAGQFLGFTGIVAISLIGLWAAALTIPRAWFRVLGFLPLAVGIKHLLHFHKNGEQPASKFNVLSIAGITLANGADNVGIYVPFFAISRSYLWMILNGLVLWREMAWRTPHRFAVYRSSWSLGRPACIRRAWNVHPDLAMTA
jgi:hypothetical protein